MRWVAITLSLISLLATGAFFMGKRIGRNQCYQEVKDVSQQRDSKVHTSTVRAMSYSNNALAERLRKHTRGNKKPTVFTPTGRADP